MGVRVTGRSRFEDPNWFKTQLREKMFTAMSDAVTEAVEDMKAISASRKESITGDMIAAMAGETLIAAEDKIIGRFGFLNSQQLYYTLQTGNDDGSISGFAHYPDGKFIEASMAMRDSYMMMVEKLLNSLNDIV